MEGKVFIDSFRFLYFGVGEGACSPRNARFFPVIGIRLLAYILPYTNSYTNRRRFQADILGLLQTQKSPQT